MHPPDPSRIRAILPDIRVQGYSVKISAAPSALVPNIADYFKHSDANIRAIRFNLCRRRARYEAPVLAAVKPAGIRPRRGLLGPR